MQSGGTSGTVAPGSLYVFNLCQPGGGNPKPSCAHPGAHVFVSQQRSCGGIAYKPQRAVAENVAQWGAILLLFFNCYMQSQGKSFSHHAAKEM